VQILAGGHSNARFIALGPQVLKGFDAPVEVFRVAPPTGTWGSMFADIGQHEIFGQRPVASLDFWEQLPTMQRVKVEMVAALALPPGDVVCDIGCGTGSGLVRHARTVGPTGRVIGVDPSPTMIAEARRCADDEGVWSAHRGRRSDWGSLMIHPGDRDVIRRFKPAIEQGPMAKPWAGRTLYAGLLDAGRLDAGLLDAGLLDVSSRPLPIVDGPGITATIAGIFARHVGSRLATSKEVDALVAALDEALDRGAMVFAFTMFVTSGRRGALELRRRPNTVYDPLDSTQGA